MYEKHVEADGLKMVQPELKGIAAIVGRGEFAGELGHLHRILYLPLQGRIFSTVRTPAAMNWL